MRKILKGILLKFPLGKRIWQITKATLLLRQTSFRALFFEVNKNDICIDIGANIGYASLVIWLKGAKCIYAIEPNIVAFNVLKNNIHEIKNINILNLAVSSATKKENLYLHKKIDNISDSEKILDLSQASSLLSSKTNLGSCFYEVEGIKLKDLIEKFNINPTVIKCDIEGGEYIIYKDLIELAKSSNIRKIFVECHAKKYPKYQKLHKEFMKLIKENKLENIIDTSWH